MINLLPGSQNSKAAPVLDVTKVELPSGDNVGGPILALHWERGGRHLAVLFEESHLIAVFCTTQLTMQLKITPWYVVNYRLKWITFVYALKKKSNILYCCVMI